MPHLDTVESFEANEKKKSDLKFLTYWIENISKAFW